MADYYYYICVASSEDLMEEGKIIISHTKLKHLNVAMAEVKLSKTLKKYYTEPVIFRCFKVLDKKQLLLIESIVLEDKFCKFRVGITNMLTCDSFFVLNYIDKLITGKSKPKVKKCAKKCAKKPLSVSDEERFDDIEDEVKSKPNTPRAYRIGKSSITKARSDSEEEE